MTKILIKLGLLAALLVATGFVSVWKFGHREQSGGGFLDTKVNEKITLSVLKSEAMSFLVTRRTTTQLVVEHDESNLFGDWNGVYWVTVRWNWGVDLSKLEEKDLRREGDKIVCHLPEPELLEFTPLLETEGFFSKSSFVPKVQEMFNGGQQRATLRALLMQKAMKFADEEHLRPSRRQLAEQLNGNSSFIKKAAGADVVFE
jgi:hypothetical protein